MAAISIKTESQHIALQTGMGPYMCENAIPLRLGQNRAKFNRQTDCSALEDGRRRMTMCGRRPLTGIDSPPDQPLRLPIRTQRCCPYRRFPRSTAAALRRPVVSVHQDLLVGDRLRPVARSDPWTQLRGCHRLRMRLQSSTTRGGLRARRSTLRRRLG